MKELIHHEIVQFIEKQGKSAHCFGTNQELGKYLGQRVNDSEKEKLLVVFFSNGSFDGVIQEFTQKMER